MVHLSALILCGKTGLLHHMNLSMIFFNEEEVMQKLQWKYNAILLSVPCCHGMFDLICTIPKYLKIGLVRWDPLYIIAERKKSTDAIALELRLNYMRNVKKVSIQYTLILHLL
jgi:hypothetical protein